MISIVIITYNRPKQLEKTLFNVLALEGKKEIIVVNNGNHNKNLSIWAI